LGWFKYYSLKRNMFFSCFKHHSLKFMNFSRLDHVKLSFWCAHLAGIVSMDIFQFSTTPTPQLVKK